jgi:hypothetical protein
LKKKFAALAAVAVSAVLTMATPAQAHRYPYDAWQARGTVYNLWNAHCGNGDTWVCVNRQLQLTSAPVGEHSWAVYYSWYEARIWGGDRRWCDVYVRYDAHIGAVVQMYQNETCHS